MRKKYYEKLQECVDGKVDILYAIRDINFNNFIKTLEIPSKVIKPSDFPFIGTMRNKAFTFTSVRGLKRYYIH